MYQLGTSCLTNEYILSILKLSCFYHQSRNESLTNRNDRRHAPTVSGHAQHQILSPRIGWFHQAVSRDFPSKNTIGPLKPCWVSPFSHDISIYFHELSHNFPKKNPFDPQGALRSRAYSVALGPPRKVLADAVVATRRCDDSAFLRRSPRVFSDKTGGFFPCVESMILIFYKRISERKGCGGLYARFQVGIDSRQRWGWLIANEHGDFTTKYLRFEWVWLLFTSPNRKNPPIPNHGSSNYWI